MYLETVGSGLLLMLSCVAAASRPHIIFIVADDLGWNDVSWTNPDIRTPTLDKLARKGVILNSSYVQPTCSPSRGSFMTGYYPHHTGFQGANTPYRPSYLPTNLQVLPEALKKDGYATHMIGKWHLGYCNWMHTPTFRGFDSFYGFYSGSQDYVTHTKSGAYDFRMNTSVHHPPKGRYSTSLFAKRAVEVIRDHDPESSPLFMFLSFQSVHTPLQISRRYYNLYPGVKNNNRRIYSAMVTAMDDAIKKVTIALRKYKYLKNTAIVFTSDNGAATYAAGSNWPLRGSKTTLWEGGTRVPTFVYSKTLLRKPGYVSNELFHAVDWYPTLMRLAGGVVDADMDGVNQWPVISKGHPSPRQDFIYSYDLFRGRGAIRVGDYKLIYGSPGPYNGWYPVPERDCGRKLFYGYRKEEDLTGSDEIEERTSFRQHGLSVFFGKMRKYLKSAAKATGVRQAWSSVSDMYHKYRCRQLKYDRMEDSLKKLLPRVQLFNIRDDPLEQVNLASSKRMLVSKLLRRLKEEKRGYVEHKTETRVKWADPKYHNGNLSPGWC